MTFSRFEEIMIKRGVVSLADMARELQTTPQAVSNWKARDQVPYHIVAKLNQSEALDAENQDIANKGNINILKSPEEEPTLFDVFITISKYLKIIILFPIVTGFITFTYIQFVQKNYYVSEATLMLPYDKDAGSSGLAGIASQFGINIGSGSSEIDLSSPSLFPELIKSRTFSERILDKKFYSKKYDAELTLLAILTHGDQPAQFGKDTLIINAIADFGKMVNFNVDPMSAFSVISVRAEEPRLAKELADEIILELEKLNRLLKSRTVNEKTTFINNRIKAVLVNLNESENKLKIFREQNMQISTPSLLLQEEKLSRDLEIETGIYLTLKQQLELSKIEEIQKSSIVQILDPPQLPLYAISNNKTLKVILSIFIGFGLGLAIAFVRQYVENADKYERKKIFKGKSFLRKKTYELLTDYRVTGILTLLLAFGMPYYLGHESQNPQFFGIYSTKAFTVVVFYLITLIVLFSITVYNRKR